MKICKMNQNLKVYLGTLYVYSSLNHIALIPNYVTKTRGLWSMYFPWEKSISNEHLRDPKLSWLALLTHLIFVGFSSLPPIWEQKGAEVARSEGMSKNQSTLNLIWTWWNINKYVNQKVDSLKAYWLNKWSILWY